MIKINNFFYKAFIILGLSGTINPNLKAGDEKKRAFIALVQELFPNHEFIQRAFSQDLEVMGIEKSPFEPEIMAWANRRKKRKNQTMDWHEVREEQSTRKNKEKKIFETLLLKAMISFFDDKNKHIRKEEFSLDFDTEHVSDDFDRQNTLHQFIFFNEVFYHQQKITNKQKRIQYFFQNFNNFLEWQQELSFLLKSRFHGKGKFFNRKGSFCHKSFDIICETHEMFKKQDKEIENHFSDNFFKNFNQRMFYHFNDIEYIFFWNYFTLEETCDHSSRNLFQNYCINFRSFFRFLVDKNIVFSKNGLDKTYKMTEHNLQKMIKTILLPLKGLFFYRHTIAYGLHFFNAEKKTILEKLNEGEFLSLEREKSITTIIREDVENFYIKKALCAAYKIFFISFMEEDSIFKFLNKFKVVDYNNYLFKLKNKIKPSLTKEEMDLHENIYTSKDGLNFALCAKNQFKYKGKTNNFLSFSVLEYFLEFEDYVDILRDKDNNFFQKMEESLKPLSISFIPECFYIRHLALERIQFLKNTMERIKSTKTILP